MIGMFVARLVCSDSACAEEAAAEARTLRELDVLMCECGCALEVIGWPDWVGEPAEVVVLRARGERLRDAA
jgi:hypothetical protein